MSFATDLEISHKKELEFEEYIKTKYGVLTENSQDKGNFPDWDIRITATTKNNKVTTFEVKYNKDYAQNTIVVEECRIINQERIPTGISLSNADYYVFSIENNPNWYIITKEKLFKLIKETKFPNRYMIRDKNDWIIQIFDKPYFLTQCTKI
jgi:hypothetical protein